MIEEVCTDDVLKEQLELDAILTVVDGCHCLQHILGEASSSGRTSEVCSVMQIYTSFDSRPPCKLALAECQNCWMQAL